MKSGILSLAASLMMAGPIFGAKKFWEEVPYISRKFKLKDMVLEGKLAF